MKTLTEKYKAVLEGKYNKKQFVRDARLSHPNHITQYNGFDDTVAILKNKGLVFEISDDELGKILDDLDSDRRRRQKRASIIVSLQPSLVLWLQFYGGHEPKIKKVAGEKSDDLF